MKIKRVVSGLILQGETIYFLNGYRVWINGVKSCIHVGDSIKVRRNWMDDTRDAALCELAYKIGTEPTGNIKIDPANENITKFLKVTNCI